MPIDKELEDYFSRFHWDKWQAKRDPYYLPDKAMAGYACGRCQCLALALHDETGWPIILGVMYSDEPGMVFFEHVLVETPDGTLFDVDGPHSPEAIKKEWHLDDFILVSRDELTAMTRSTKVPLERRIRGGSERIFRPCGNMRLTRKIAQYLLERYAEGQGSVRAW